MELIGSGLPCLLTPQKGPITKGWAELRERLPEAAEACQIAKTFPDRGDRVGVVMILGKLAKFVVMDFDAEGAFDRWHSRLSTELQHYLREHCPHVATPKGYGRHVHLPLTSEALSPDGWFTKEVLDANFDVCLAHLPPGEDGSLPIAIELRLPMKHAIMVPGSGFGVHDKHPDRTWTYLRENGPKLTDHAHLRAVSQDDFFALVGAARDLDDPEAREQKRKKIKQREELVRRFNAAKSEVDLPADCRRHFDKARESSTSELRPGDDFNERATWDDVLLVAGWESLGNFLWRRPGGTGISASTKFGFLYVFTTNAYPLEDSDSRGAAYTKFTAYAFLHHDGDFGCAAKALAELGYGEKLTPEARVKKQAGDRKVVTLRPGSLGGFLDEVIEIVKEKDATRGRNRILFERDGQLLARRRTSIVDGKLKAAVFDPLCPASTQDLLSNFILFQRETQGGPVPVDLPDAKAKALLKRGHWGFPQLRGVSNTPIVRLNGEVSGEYGFDQASGLWLDVKDMALEELNRSIPDRACALRSLDTLKELFKEFPFKGPKDLSVALGSILSVLGRNHFDHAPLFLFTATTPGSGKSYIVECISWITTGEPANMVQQTGEVEMRKMIHAELLEMPQFVCFENVEHPLGGPAICSVLTQAKFGGRILGKSKSVAPYTTSTTWFATGNNIVIRGDLGRRVLSCELDANCERPEEREFTFSPQELIIAQRHKYVAAALTMLQAYVLAGCPMPESKLVPFGSFGQWCKVVRGCLIWLGLEDPCANRNSFAEEDYGRELLCAVLNDLSESFGKEAFLASDVVKAAAMNQGLQEALLECGGKGQQLSSRSTGHILKKFLGHWVGGLRLVKLGTLQNAGRYRIEVSDDAGAGGGQ